MTSCFMTNRFENWSLRGACSLQNPLPACWISTPPQMPMQALHWKTRTDCPSSKPWLVACRLLRGCGQAPARLSAMAKMDLCCKIRKTKEKLRSYCTGWWKILSYEPELGNEPHEPRGTIRGIAMRRILGNFC